MMIVNSGRFGAGGGGGGSDPDFASTVLLLDMDGADGSQTFTDESAAARGNATASVGAQVDTDQSVFGGASLLCDGGSFISYADHGDFNLGSGDFTLECWIRFSNLTGFQAIMGQYQATTQIGWLFDFTGSANNQLRFLWTTGGSGATLATVQPSWTPTTGVWYAVCAERSGSTIRIYVDGSMIGSGSIGTSTIHNSTTAIRIAALSSGGITNFFKGWIDELRITKGVARYASDSGYTVPTEAFPRS